jgi:hypothetical protein
MLDFAPNLQAQRAASENKGGKTYTDLKKCITIGMEAHKNYLEVCIYLLFCLKKSVESRKDFHRVVKQFLGYEC